MEFLAGCLRWDPAERFKPDDALQHEWITDGYLDYGFQNSRRDGERDLLRGILTYEILVPESNAGTVFVVTKRIFLHLS